MTVQAETHTPHPARLSRATLSRKGRGKEPRAVAEPDQRAGVIFPAQEGETHMIEADKHLHPGDPDPLATPSRAFATPQDVLKDRKLGPDDKLLLLKRWEQEANDLMRAADESMAGSDNNRLHEIRKAIDELVA